MLSKLVLLAIIFSAQVMAGDRVGNGGDVVVCANNTIEMLDAYEAEFNGSERMVFEGKDYQSMVRKIIKSKLEKIQPKRAKRYLEHLASFSKEAVFASGIKLDDIDDAGMVTLPVGCHLEQVAIQLSNSELPPGRKRYTVKLDLWKRLDEENKAILILHEIVYREALENNSSNSMFVRAMVEQLIKKKMGLATLLELDFRITSGLEFKTANMRKLREPNAEVKVTRENDVLTIKSPTLNIRFDYCEVTDDGCPDTVLGPGESFSFDIPSGEITSLRTYGEEVVVMIPANQLTIIKGFREAHVVANKNIKYIGGQYFGGKGVFSLKVMHKISNQMANPIFFSNVKRLQALFGATTYAYAGDFSVVYNNLVLQDAKGAYLEFDAPTGSILKYGMREGTVISAP